MQPHTKTFVGLSLYGALLCHPSVSASPQSTFHPLSPFGPLSSLCALPSLITATADCRSVGGGFISGRPLKTFRGLQKANPRNLFRLPLCARRTKSRFAFFFVCFHALRRRGRATLAASPAAFTCFGATSEVGQVGHSTLEL